ncbi:hypothetical protein EH165_04520 [Nakamurella antarctica]|uniref:Uncharacterized protein n=1 Tax=Nakamurella antarctica TaxID=1902245 RepID=A0A3G8ZJJ4_9ACTN|nr:type I-E CRISPR-associated protein Cse2/CasB [Nakamurella antarctica]AZI57532.1 hypothetical protein EH165_04520 [Nakamurella antarctica]
MTAAQSALSAVVPRGDSETQTANPWSELGRYLMWVGHRTRNSVGNARVRVALSGGLRDHISAKVYNEVELKRVDGIPGRPDAKNLGLVRALGLIASHPRSKIDSKDSIGTSLGKLVAQTRTNSDTSQTMISMLNTSNPKNAVMLINRMLSRCEDLGIPWNAASLGHLVINLHIGGQTAKRALDRLAKDCSRASYPTSKSAKDFAEAS